MADAEMTSGSIARPGCLSHNTVRSPDRASTSTTANWLVAPGTVQAELKSTPPSVRLVLDRSPSSSPPKLPMYEARQPSRATTAEAVAVWPPGSRANRCSRCFELLAGYSATTATRSTLLSPTPTTSKRRSAAGAKRKGKLTTSGAMVAGSGRTVEVDLRLSFAYSFSNVFGEEWRCFRSRNGSAKFWTT